MTKRIGIYPLVLLLLTPLLGTAANAGVVRIECPTEITSPLPYGWWVSPTLNKVVPDNWWKTPTATELNAITFITHHSGETSLKCGYYLPAFSILSPYPAVWISTYAPEGAGCLEDVTGFNCVTPEETLDITVTRVTPPLVIPQYIPPASLFIYKSGTIRLQPNKGMDLDNGTVGANRGTDVRFNAETTGRHFLQPVNGAKAALAGPNEASPEICRALGTYTTGRISVNQLPAGTSVCVITDEGRYSAFRVSSAPATSWEAFRVNFKTWRN